MEATRYADGTEIRATWANGQAIAKFINSALRTTKAPKTVRKIFSRYGGGAAARVRRTRAAA